MNTAWLIVGSSNIILSVLIIASSIPLVLRKVKMNRWYGIRISKAFSSPENWEKLNEYGGLTLIYWSIPLLLIGAGIFVASFFVPETALKDQGLIIALFPLSGLFLMGAIIQIVIWSKKLPD